LTSEIVDTVYVFNIEMDLRARRGVTARDGSALEKNPFLDIRVRQAIDLAIDRKALAEIAMEGLGKEVNQVVTPSIFGYNKAIAPKKYDPAAARNCSLMRGYRNGSVCPSPRRRIACRVDVQVGTSIAQMLAAIGIDTTPNAQPVTVFFPARTRGEYSFSMSGWGTLTGEAHYTLSSPIRTTKRRNGRLQRAWLQE